jgi:muramoyltetrapeptide carboxypeptidase LdcA involved in peptidoglycan recycling
MRYPKFLAENGTIGLVAPSFGCSFDPYVTCLNEAEKYFKGRGYHIEEGPNTRKGEGIGISSTPENCGKELTDMYVSPSNDMLISVGGGELMCETIDHVDFKKVKAADPKWFMGYSDNTNFTFLLNTICDVASIYGPNMPEFGMEKLHSSLTDTIDVFTGKLNRVSGYDLFEIQSFKDENHPTVGYNLTEKKQLKLFMGENEMNRLPVVEGRIIGGCLDCLANLVGTKYDNVAQFNEKYSDDKIIWFVEACELNVMSIRRALWNMDRAGWFKNVAGFIVGRPDVAFGQQMMGLDQYSAVTGILGKYNVPIIMDADIGHISPTLPIICGSVASVSTDEGNITLNYSLI